MNIIETAGELLKGLGQTPEEVAVRLAECNIRGVRNTVRFLNPVVRYVQDRIKSEAIALDVTRNDTLRISFPKDRKVEVPLPNAIREFIRVFDRGGYPSLELNPNDNASISRAHLPSDRSPHEV